MKVALLCSGLGNVLRGHEIFARDLFRLLADDVDMVLFKGGGSPALRERVVEHVPRDSKALDGMHVAVSEKWRSAVMDEERIRIEGETFAYGALKPLLEGDFDIIHCLEQEVCRIVYDQRNLFTRTPKVVFSNGGAIPARDLPPCDAVQEHTDYNLARSAKGKSFMIPHGVDLKLFDPAIESDYRRQHGIPADARVVISVGTVCYWHKRMDYVIREVAQVEGAYLVIVGQECADTPAIKELGRSLMGNRIVFDRLEHHDLPRAYRAADVFVLGSLFETFGIVYVEAMAMGLPVFCTDHPNQRSIVKDGVFVDMSRGGELAGALRRADRQELARLASLGRKRAAEQYDIARLRSSYLDLYRRIMGLPSSLPTYSVRSRVSANIRNALRPIAGMLRGSR
jgi:glycosyltransferase involved in cell wall biosynthesis